MNKHFIEKTRHKKNRGIYSTYEEITNLQGIEHICNELVSFPCHLNTTFKHLMTLDDDFISWCWFKQRNSLGKTDTNYFWLKECLRRDTFTSPSTLFHSVFLEVTLPKGKEELDWLIINIEKKKKGLIKYTHKSFQLYKYPQ